MRSSTAFISIMFKDLRVLLRDRTAVLFIFGLPLIFALLFGVIAHQSPTESGLMKVLVYNADSGGVSQALQVYMGKMGMKITKAKSAVELQKKTLTGAFPAGVLIPEGFSASLRTWAYNTAHGSASLQPKLNLYFDPALGQMETITETALTGAVQRTIGPMLQQAYISSMPIQFRAYASQMMRRNQQLKPVQFDVTDSADPQKYGLPTAGDRIMPGLIIYFIFFMANSVAITLIVERQEGTLKRMLGAPITPGQILFGKMLARAFIGSLQIAMLLIIGKLFLHLTLGHMLPEILFIFLLCIFTATGLGLLIAAYGKTQEQIQGMTTLALLLMGFISGCLFPRQLLSPFMRQLSYITPHAWALHAYNDLALRHLSLIHAFPSLLVLSLFGIIFYGIALMRFRYE